MMTKYPLPGLAIAAAVAAAPAAAYAQTPPPPAPVAAPKVWEIGQVDGWTIRESSQACSAGNVWADNKSQLFFAMKGTADAALTLFYDGGLSGEGVVHDGAGNLKLNGKASPGTFAVGLGQNQSLTVFRATPVAMPKPNGKGERRFSYELRTSTAVDTGKFTMSGAAWNAWRACLGV